MSRRFVFEAKLGAGPGATRASNDAWDELCTLVGDRNGAKQKTRDFWEEIFGSEDALLYDGEGNDRTDLVRAVVERLDRTSCLVQALAERVAVLERLAVQDEARIALEIEKLRKES